MVRPVYTGRKGYEQLLDVDADRIREARRIAHHRVLAWVDGEISTDELLDPSGDVEIDHLSGVPWYSTRDVIEAVDRREHGRRTRDRARRRRA